MLKNFRTVGIALVLSALLLSAACQSAGTPENGNTPTAEPIATDNAASPAGSEAAGVPAENTEAPVAQADYTVGVCCNYTEDWREIVTFGAYDLNDSTLWEKTIEAKEGSEYDSIGVYEGSKALYVVQNDIGVTAYDKASGQELFTLSASEYSVKGGFLFAEDAAGNVYVSGQEGPDLLGFSPEGKVLCYVKQADPRLTEPTGLTLEADGSLTVRYAYASTDSVRNRGGWCTLDAQGKLLNSGLGAEGNVTASLPMEIDLNGDGVMETLDLLTEKDQWDNDIYSVSVTSNGKTYTGLTDIQDTWYDLWVKDIDGDGKQELFFCGDLASDDYTIWAWRFDTSLQQIYFASDNRYDEDNGASLYGSLQGFEGDKLLISSTVDMLGTYGGEKLYAMNSEGKIAPTTALWRFYNYGRPLTTTREITAYKAELGAEPGEEITLPVGTTITPTGSNGSSLLYFTTAHGVKGCFKMERGDSFFWMIGELSEESYFNELPYAD